LLKVLAVIRLGCFLGQKPAGIDNALSLRDHRRSDPEWGVRNLEAVTDVAEQNGLVLEEVIEMPANNRSVVFRRS
jgi:hypothetical protein